MSLGKRLREARKAKKMNQDELAEEVERTAATISDWETDKAEPSLTQLRKLADILDVTPSYLIEDEKHISHEVKSLRLHHSFQGFEWVVDLDIYPPSKRKQWRERVAKSATLFSDVIQGKRDRLDPADGVRLRSAFEARAIRVTKVATNKELENQLVERFNLNRAFVIDINMPADKAVTCMVGCELVGLATASPTYEIFKYEPTETTNILIAHGMVLHRFVQNIRPSGYIYNGNKFLAMTSVRDVEQAHPDRTANALVSTLAAKFPRGRGIHMPFLNLDVQEKVFSARDTLQFSPRNREGVVANIIRTIKSEPVTVFISAIRMDNFGNPITTPSDGGNAATTTDHLREKLEKLGKWEQFGGDVSGNALNRDGKLLERSDYYCSLPPDLLQEVINRGSQVWLIGAGAERKLTFQTCLQAKIANNVVVTRDLASAILNR